jgi:CheY-like chemotaxis protein
MKTILVVEDDEFMRTALLETLEDEGYQACGASSGPEALELAGQKPFDLVVTDVRMPGMDGLECLQKLKEIHPELSSIVITGYADREAPTRALQLEASDYLYKPFNIDQLVNRVAQLLDAESTREASLGLLGSLRTGYQKLLDRLGGQTRQRSRAFQTFFVAVRSRKLDPTQATAHWEQLVSLERDLEAGSSSDLAQRYREVTAQLSAQLQSDPGRDVTDEDRVAAEKLCKRIREGQLTPELLQLAPYLGSHEDQAEVEAVQTVFGESCCKSSDQR